MSAELLERVLVRTARRVRIARGLAWGSWALSVGASLLVAALLLARALGGSLALALALPVLGSMVVLSWAIGALLPVSSTEVAARLDAADGLHGRMRTAIGLRALTPAMRTPFMEAALRDAARHTDPRAPRRAVPITLPSVARWSVVPLALLALIARLTERTTPPGELLRRHAPAASLLHADDLAAARTALAAIVADDPDAPLAHIRTAYAALLAQLAEGAVTADAAVATLLALSARLAQAATEHDAAALAALADQLVGARGPLGRVLGAPVRAAVGAALGKLGKALETGTLEAPARAQLQAALARARAAQPVPGKPEAAEPSLLRDGARTGAQHASRAERASRRTLERLSRALDRASDALAAGRDREAGSAIHDAADALARHARDEAARKALVQAMSQLRELLAREAAPRGQHEAQPAAPSAARAPSDATSPDSAQRARRARFDLRARGERSPGGDAGTAAWSPPGDDDAGKPMPASGGGRGPVRVAAHTRPEQLVVEQLVRKPAGGAAPQNSTPSSDDASGAPVAAPRAAATGYEDARLRGARGAGPTRSEVIHGVAESSLASAPYRAVYAAYRAHAEAVLEHDAIPPGQRFFVRRYFDLLRPRSAEPRDE